MQLSSGAASPLGALLILAALLTAKVAAAVVVKAYSEVLPWIMAWFEDRLSSLKTATEDAPIRVHLDVDSDAESDGFTVLDAFLLIAVTVLVISWSCGGSSKSKYAAARAVVSRSRSESPKVAQASEAPRSPRSPKVAAECSAEPVLKTLGKAPLAWNAARPRSQGSLDSVPEDTEVKHPDVKPEEEDNLLDTLETNLLDGTWSTEESYNLDLPQVHFQVQMQSKPGDRLLVVGGDASLGSWMPDQSQIELFTDESNYPIWSGSWTPSNSPAEHLFKLVLVKANGAVFWESIENRSLHVLPSDELLVQTQFNSSDFQVVSCAEFGSDAAGG